MQERSHIPSRGPMEERKEECLRAKVGKFVQQYARKKRPGKGEPNDRHYDRKLAHRIKKMKPEELDELLNG